MLLLRIENIPALQLCAPLNRLFNSVIVIVHLKCCKQEGLALSISPVSLSAGQWAGPAQTKSGPGWKACLLSLAGLISCTTYLHDI